MTIDDILLDSLLERAAQSERRRMNLDLRNSEGDRSQRMLNALLPGTVLPVHRHRASSETVVVLRGRMDEVFFDAEGHEMGRVHLDPSKGCFGVNIPVGEWHTIEVLEPTVILETKDGPYMPQSDEDILK